MARPILFRLAEVRAARGKQLGVGPSLAGALPLPNAGGVTPLNNYVLTADAGAFTSAGVAATLTHGYPLTAGTGTFTETGVDAPLLVAHRLTAVTSSFTETGQAASLLAGRRITGLAAPSGTSVASDLAGATTPPFNPTLPNAALAFAPTGTPTSVVSSTANAGVTRNLYLFGPVGWPTRAAWPADAFTVKLWAQRTGGSSTGNVRAFVGRVNAAGVLQEETTASASVILTTAGASITLAVPSLAWAVGSESDRLYVRLLFTQGPALSGTFTVKLDTVASGSDGTTISAAWLRDPSEIAALSLSGTVANLLVGYRLTAAAGAFTIAGVASTGGLGRTVVTTTGAFAESGAAAALRKTSTLAAPTGTFALTGQAAALDAGRTIAATPGSFSETGQAASLLRGAVLTAAAGAFVEAGAAAVLSKATPGAPVLPAETGTFAATGQRADLLRGLRITAESGGLTVTGGAALLTVSPATVTALPLAAGGRLKRMPRRLPARRPVALVAACGAFFLDGRDATLSVDVPFDDGAAAFGLGEFTDDDALVGV